MKNKKGFTLIELLVVIAIIGLLATLAVVSLGTARAKARDAKRMGDMRALQSAIELSINDNAVAPVDPTDWADLGADLLPYLQGGAPEDPDTSTPGAYQYCYETASVYMIWAVLETYDTAGSIAGDLDTSVNVEAVDCIASTGAAAVPDCTDANGGFCLGTTVGWIVG